MDVSVVDVGVTRFSPIIKVGVLPVVGSKLVPETVYVVPGTALIVSVMFLVIYHWDVNCILH